MIKIYIFRPGTWKWRPIPAWNLEMKTGEFWPGTWNLRLISAWNLEMETDSSRTLISIIKFAIVVCV
ncbi:unnamed protein product [Rhizophagus irregularis]|nr:unnamed protein product [Rhizophagus irregularis]